MFKTLLGSMLAVGMLLTSHASEAQATSRLQTVLHDGVLRVGTTGDFNPMSIRDVASGSYKGFEIDAANQLAQDLGVKVKFVTTDWKTMVAGVLANKYDIVMSGTSLDTGRAKVVGYTQPYAYVGTVPMTLQKNAGKFTSWGDIDKEGVTVSVILGTVFEQQAKALLPHAKIIAVEAPATGYQEVLAGRADVTITSNVDASALTQRYPQIAVIAGAGLRNKRPLAYITAQDDQVWINFLNSWLELHKSGGFFDALSKKWHLQ